MNIPIEILWLFFAMSFGLVIVGYMARFSIPISIFFFASGALLVALFIMTDNIIVDYAEAEIKDISIQELYHLHDWNVELTIFKGGNEARAIFVSPTSPLISTGFFDRLDCIQLPLKKVGSPVGNATVAIFADTDLDIKPIKFGEIDVSTLTTVFQWFEFCLPDTQHHFIKGGDRIGIRYNDASSNSTNALVIAVDTTDPINTTIYMQRFSSGTLLWTDELTTDMSAVLYNRATTQEIVTEEKLFEFTQEIKVFMALIASIMMLMGGAIEINARR